MLEGTDLLDSPATALAAAEQVGYPVMLKSTAGGGGIGMRVCRSPQELRTPSLSCSAWGRATSAMRASSSSATSNAPAIWKCRYSATAGGVLLTLGVRDCSVQRRNQKVRGNPCAQPARCHRQRLARRP